MKTTNENKKYETNISNEHKKYNRNQENQGESMWKKPTKMEIVQF